MGKMKCCVESCESNNENKSENISFFGFPLIKEFRIAWLKAIGLPEGAVKPRSKICSRHFLDTELATVGRRKYVIGTALPRIISSPNKTPSLDIEGEPMNVSDDLQPICSVERIDKVEMVTCDLCSGPSEQNVDENSSSCIEILKSDDDLLETIPEIPDKTLPLPPLIPLKATSTTSHSQVAVCPPHRPLSLEEKIEIIKEFERKKSRMHIPHLFHCHMGQVSLILKYKIELMSEFMRIQAIRFVLNEFVLRCRFYPIELSEEFLLDRSDRIAKILNISNFQAQEYWQKTFKGKFKLTEIDWSTWSILKRDNFLQKSLELVLIIEDLRKEKGETLIPLPKIMDEAQYQRAVQLLIETTDPYSGYMVLTSNPQSYDQECQNIDENSVVTIMSDGDNDINSLPDSCQFVPNPLSIYNVEIDDPMNIDCYSTALSYFQPLEQFLLSKRNDRVISVINQLGKALLRAVDAEESCDQLMTDELSCPSVVNEVQIENYEDAVKYLHPLEDFLLDKMDMRGVGMINQLEILLNAELSKT